MLNETPDCPLHTVLIPEMVPLLPGNGLTVIFKEEACPFPQLLVPVTVMIPDNAEVPKSTVMELLFCVTILAPEGRVQRYPVALAIGGTVYTTLFWPWQTVLSPVIVPAVAG